MPGLIGFTAKPDSSFDVLQVLGNMQDCITYRDFHVKDELFYDDQVAGTRSHINVIQKNSQPHHDSGIYAWLDGEFYNQKDLVDNKISYPEDLAILINLYKQNKNSFEFLEKIDGIYSAVIYDTSTQQVHLITDRYGLQYLYWTVYQNNFIWTSEIKALQKFSDFSFKFNQQAIKNFLNIGYYLEDSTCFDGVNLLSSGTILTFNIITHSIKSQSYWSWDKIHPFNDGISEDEITCQLAELFIKSVNQRYRQSGKVGCSLSGGLDSRAILAAMQNDNQDIHTITFGTRECDDIKLACRVAQVKGSIHHIIEINKDNWLIPRFEGIWWTEGQLNCLHMHGIESFFLISSQHLFNICLNGYLGDATIGGSYLSSYQENELEVINNRGRRFIAQGLKLQQVYFQTRIPFFSNEFLALTMSLDQKYRNGSYIYKKMLLKAFPEFFQNIPWQKTGLPISYPNWIVIGNASYLKIKQKIIRNLNKFNLNWRDSRNYTNYAQWLRENPNFKIFESVLFNENILYNNFVDKDKILNLWQHHLNGQDHAEKLCLIFTLEVWLQQLFNGKYLTIEDLELNLTE